MESYSSCDAPVLWKIKSVKAGGEWQAAQFPTLVRRGAEVAALGYGTRNQYGAALQATSFGAPGNMTPLYERASPRP